MARERRQADRGEHAREREQHRQARRDERAERDEQDRQGHGQGGVLRPLEVLVERVAQLVVRAREAELGDGEAGVPLLGPLDRVEHGLHPLVGGVLVALDLELDERRPPVVRHLARVRRLERRAHPLHLRQPLDRSHDVRHRRPEGRIAQRARARLHEHALGGAALGARAAEQLLRPLRVPGRRVRLLQHLRAGDRPQRDGDDAEAEPRRHGRLPVPGAPPPGARREIEPHPAS